MRKAFAQMKRIRPESGEEPTFTINDWVDLAGDAADDSGRIELDASDEGRYSIEVKDFEGQLADQSFLVELTRDGLQRDVVLAPDLDPSAPLSGLVQTIQGEPLANVHVALIPVTGEVSCNCIKLDSRTDPSGAFSFGPFMKGKPQDRRDRSPGTLPRNPLPSGTSW